MDKGYNVFLFSASTSTEKLFSQEEAYRLKLSVSDDIVTSFENAFTTPEITDKLLQTNWLIEDTLFDPISGESYICCAVSTYEEVVTTTKTIKDVIACSIRKHLNIKSFSCVYLGKADDINQCIDIMDFAIGELLNNKGVQK